MSDLSLGFVIGVLFTVGLVSVTTGVLLWAACTEQDEYSDDL